MKIKRSLMEAVDLHIVLSIVLAVMFTIGLSVYLHPEANPKAGNGGIVMTCLFGPLFIIVQIVFILWYITGPRYPLIIENGVVTVFNLWRKTSFKVEDIVKWRTNNPYWRSTTPYKNQVFFELYDGHVYGIMDFGKNIRIEIEGLDNLLGIEEGVLRSSTYVAKETNRYVVHRGLSSWRIFFLLLLIATLFLGVWGLCGYYLADPDNGWPKYQPVCKIIAILSFIFAFASLIGFIFIMTQRKDKAVFTRDSVSFHSKGKLVVLPYSSLTSVSSVKTDFGTNNYVITTLLVVAKDKVYRVPFVRISEVDQKEVEHLTGHPWGQDA
jgi:hypothetical protein